jgi:hypothetical protein
MREAGTVTGLSTGKESVIEWRAFMYAIFLTGEREFQQ